MSDVRSFDRVAERYDETRGGIERGRQYAAELLPLLAASGPTLEVGIGTGLVAKGLDELGRSVCGVDISPLMILQAQERIGNRVAVGLAACLPVRTNSVGDAYSVWVTHLVDVAAVMADVARVLRAGGRYLVAPVAIPDPDPIVEITTPMYEAIFGTGERRDEPEALVRHAAAAGLRLVEQRSCKPQPFFQSPASEAERIETRQGAAFWDLDEERWKTIVEPTIQGLRALPAPDVAIERVTRPKVFVFTLDPA